MEFNIFKSYNPLEIANVLFLLPLKNSLCFINVLSSRIISLSHYFLFHTKDKPHDSNVNSSKNKISANKNL